MEKPRFYVINTRPNPYQNHWYNATSYVGTARNLYTLEARKKRKHRAMPGIIARPISRLLSSMSRRVAFVRIWIEIVLYLVRQWLYST